MSNEIPNSLKTDDGYITVDEDIRLYYQRVGQGINIVIVPNALYLYKNFRYLASESDRTVVFYDLRNRGRSDPISDTKKLERGIHLDVDDLEKIRQYFGLEKVDLIGHSYLGLMVILYALKYPNAVNRIVQIGAAPLKHDTKYPEHLTANENGAVPNPEEMEKLEELEKKGYHLSHPKEYCKKWWAVVRVMFVSNPEDAIKIGDECCDFPNEWPINQMKHLSDNIFPSIQQLDIPIAEIKKISNPVLTIHGTKDRNVPWGSAREWAFNLPNARLVTVDGAAHLPWIEAPKIVFQSIQTFLEGKWPETATLVKAVDPMEDV